MKDQDQNSRSTQALGDARDILARLYREIGISAVAAALQAMEPKAKTESDNSARPVQRRFTSHAA